MRDLDLTIELIPPSYKLCRSSIISLSSSVEPEQLNCLNLLQRYQNLPFNMSLKYSFSGKKILITGGGQGIGRQLVQRFHDDGAIVYTVDRNPETVAALKKALPKVTVELLDISDWDKTKKVIESFGVIDHLVNNAQLLNAESFLDITKDAIIRQFNTAIPGLINVSQVFSKALIAAGKPGTIVNVSSIASQKPFPPAIVYGALQAAIENLAHVISESMSLTDKLDNGLLVLYSLFLHK